MKEKVFFILCFVSFSVLADHACLKKATNKELLQELANRMNVSELGTGLSSIAYVNFICSYENLTVSY